MPGERLRFAFWNVWNMFDPALGVGRGPATAAELKARLDRLADCVGGFFGPGQPPDLLALAEVGDEFILRRLANRIPGGYPVVCWSPPGRANQTGLAILGRGPVAALREVAVERPTAAQRPRCLLAKCSLERGGSFHVGAIHWKSNLRRGAKAQTPTAARRESALWLRDRVLDAGDECVALAGDFNAEPFEGCFSEESFPAGRHFSKATPSRGPFYNTAWKFLAEPFSYEAWSDRPSPLEPRPKRTHDGAFVVWDQLLVSGGALRGGPIRLLEETVRYAAGPLNARHNDRGVLEPIRWNVATGAGASDHFPLLAEFEIA